MSERSLDALYAVVEDLDKATTELEKRIKELEAATQRLIDCTRALRKAE